MMDISKMSDQEKSVLLAMAVGQSPEHEQLVPQWAIAMPGIFKNDKGYVESLAQLGLIHNLYDPANMALAWRVLNWASENEAMGEYHAWWGRVVREPMWFILNQYLGSMVLGKLPPANAQRLWLDKILELAIETGLIDPTAPSDQ